MRDVSSDAGVEISPHQLVGSAHVRRIGRWRFPAYELMQDGSTVAELGRMGWISIYFGSGQKIVLADGAQWTVRSLGGGGSFAPAVFDSSGRKIATSGAAFGAYGINGRDYSGVLYPADKPRFGRANRWILRQHEEELATITRYPLSVQAAVPVHLGAVLISFVLVRYGPPDDTTLGVPTFRWG